MLRWWQHAAAALWLLAAAATPLAANSGPANHTAALNAAYVKSGLFGRPMTVDMHTELLRLHLAITRWQGALLDARRGTATDNKHFEAASMRDLAKACRQPGPSASLATRVMAAGRGHPDATARRLGSQQQPQQRGDTRAKKKFILRTNKKGRVKPPRAGGTGGGATVTAAGVRGAGAGGGTLVYPFVLADGLGHSLLSSAMVLLSVLGVNCTTMALPPVRLGVEFQMAFVPWSGSGQGGHGGGGGIPSVTISGVNIATGFDEAVYARAARPLPPRLDSAAFTDHTPADLPLFARDSARFLYCHERTRSRTRIVQTTPRQSNGLFAGRKQGAPPTNGDGMFVTSADFVESQEYPTNMDCYELLADPWRTMCDTMTGAPCFTEADETRLLSNASFVVAERAPLRYHRLNRTLFLGKLDRSVRSGATSRALSRLRENYWDNFKAQWERNRRLLAGVSPMTLLPPVPMFECSHDDFALDVAIHVRRGDITDSSSIDDRVRFEGMGGTCKTMERIHALFQHSVPCPLRIVVVGTVATERLKRRYPEGIRFRVHSESEDSPPPLGPDLTLREFTGIDFNLTANLANSAGATAAAGDDVAMVCPIGRCSHRTPSGFAIEAAYCLNTNPLFDLYCMAKADIFVPAASRFSDLVGATTKALVVLDPASAAKYSHVMEFYFTGQGYAGVPLARLDKMVLEDHLLDGMDRSGFGTTKRSAENKTAARKGKILNHT